MFSLLQDIVYYGVQHAQAETQALFHLISPNVEDASAVWNMTEVPIIAKILSLRLPFIRQDEHIFVPRLFPAITKELVLREFKDGTANKICPIDPELLKCPDFSKNRAETLEQLYVESKDKIPIRILAWKDLNLKATQPGFVRQLSRKASDVIMGSEGNSEEAIVINIHGGGWIALSSQTYRVFYSRWTKNLKMVNFCIDYRLAPKNPYPESLDDIWQAYLWIINYAETILGIKILKRVL